MKLRDEYPWLTGRPIAHRGLHDRAQGVVENTLSAARAAISANYAIECDVQLSADGEAMVFHDFTIERLTMCEGRVDAIAAKALAAMPMRDCDDHIAPLPQFLAAVDGCVPLFCEIKSRFDGDMRLVRRVAACAQNYGGPLALMSFDPDVIEHLRDIHSDDEGAKRPSPLGIIAQSDFSGSDTEWSRLPPARKRALREFLHYPATRPDFVAWRAEELPAAIPLLMREGLGIPVIGWTLRSHAASDRAGQWCDQVAFEGFRP